MSMLQQLKGASVTSEPFETRIRAAVLPDSTGNTANKNPSRLPAEGFLFIGHARIAADIFGACRS